MADFFHDIPDNPRPQNAAGDYFIASDGARIRYACFAAVARPLKGTVILLPGRNEPIEKYFETIRDLADRGFGTATLDWRGQGGSDRLIRDPRRGYVKSFADYKTDLDRFFEDVILPDCRGPYYVLAHSTGALIALLASPSMVNRVQRMVLVAPLLAFAGLPVSMEAVGRVAGVLSMLGLGRLYAARGPKPRDVVPFRLNKLTTDPARYRRNCVLYATHPELSLGGPTIAWVRAACEAVKLVRGDDFMAGIQVPILFIGAGQDEVVSTPAIADYARRLRGGSVLVIDGARHEILQEADVYREQLLAAFDAYVPGSVKVVV